VNHDVLLTSIAPIRMLGDDPYDDTPEEDEENFDGFELEGEDIFEVDDDDDEEDNLDDVDDDAFYEEDEGVPLDDLESLVDVELDDEDIDDDGYDIDDDDFDDDDNFDLYGDDD
jgi:hypothetical protein